MGSNKKRSHELIYKTYTKIEAKRLKATTFAIAKLEEQMGSNRENSNIAIIILKKLPFLNVTKIISHFYGSNNIFANCIYLSIGKDAWHLVNWSLYQCTIYITPKFP